MKAFTVTADWACGPDEAFDRLTDSAIILRETGVETSIAPHPGGRYEWYFLDDGPAGERGSEGCTVIAVEPGQRLQSLGDVGKADAVGSGTGRRGRWTGVGRGGGCGKRVFRPRGGDGGREKWRAGSVA